LKRQFKGAGLKLVHTAPVFEMKNRLLVGFDYDLQDDDRQRFDNINGELGAQTLNQNEKVTSLGVFLQNEIKLNNQLELTLGLRYDDINFDVSDAFLADGNDSGKVDLGQSSPMLGLIYKADEQSRYYATISTAFETPTTTEFSNPNGGGFNQSLKVQESTNYEVGYRRKGESFQVELALFHIDIADELTPFELSSQPGRTFYENAGSSSRDGVEISLYNNMGNGFSLSTAYTYSDFVFERFTDNNSNAFDGNSLPGIPKHLLQFDLSWESDNGLYATLKNTYTGKLFANNANDTEVDSSLVSNLRIGYRSYLQGIYIEAFAGVNNLTDEEYNNNIRINAFGANYYEPAPERNLLASFNLRKRF
jgi:iron complex outermembrane receptor protein